MTNYPQVAEADDDARKLGMVRDAWWYGGGKGRSAVVVVQMFNGKTIQIKLRRRRRPRS